MKMVGSHDDLGVLNPTHDLSMFHQVSSSVVKCRPRLGPRLVDATRVATSRTIPRQGSIDRIPGSPQRRMRNRSTGNTYFVFVVAFSPPYSVVERGCGLF